MKKLMGVVVGLLGVAMLGWWLWKRRERAYTIDHPKEAERRFRKAA